ncbi:MULTISPECIES: hypothetical protein [unclassified Caulobacter]|uniref:hypothetical protein n=1 Tax=unclassified Caulobacter TaxID=2648921 RepID=UPI0006FE67C8|nr:MULTISPECIES: hypothetical protein [unclassified Caulobacter]KQV62823.1 hypothetical protein ASC62_04640 [Caulobacter sp. Root342]KQV71956.1 hypothetical protein ASC70_23915 [Caulobacter sp. Root343]
MEKVFVAQRVASKLYATEAAVDAAMVEVTEMMAELIQARKDLGLSPVVANGASAKFAEAIQALATARTAVVDAHAELDETRLRIGVRTRMAGVFDKLLSDGAPTGLRAAS